MQFEPHDFIVEELPLYKPSQEGTHTFFAIKKQNLTTYEAINLIAQKLNVHSKNIGYAGLKDKYAITTQVLSIEGVSPEQVLKLTIPMIQVLWAERHAHKLRVGHLRGNRFEITLRDISPTSLPSIEEKMRHLVTEGVPNRFGSQRFGTMQNTHLIGKALVKGEWEKVLNYICDSHTTQYSQFAKRMERERESETSEKAVECIPHRLRKLYLSAYQAYLFNCILEKRFPHLGKIWDGDIAIKHTNGAPFLVENANIEQPRADAFEISPSGPLFGYKMRRPIGKMLLLEKELLVTEGIEYEAFKKVVGIKLTGTRRPLRGPIEVHKIMSVEEGVRLCFTLPAGGYATVVLDEIKDHLTD